LVVATLASVSVLPLWVSPAAGAAPAVAYAMPVDLDVIDGASIVAPYGLNSSGQASGFFVNRAADGNLVWSAARWDPSGIVHLLGTLGGASSDAIGINDAGHIVGSSAIDATHPVHAFLWDPVNGMTDLGGLGGPDGQARGDAVNDHDQVAGVSSSPDGRTAVMWDPIEGPIDVGMLPGDYSSYGFGINDDGDVVGISTSTAADHAFRWNAADGITPLVTLGGAASSAYDVNNSGQIVGSAQLPNGRSHAVLWNPDGSITDLGTLGGSSSGANAINAAGQVVGVSNLPGDKVSHGFLWDPVNGMMDVGALSQASHNTGHSEITDINDHGELIGVHTLSKKVTKPATWSPLGPPTISIGSASVVEGDSGKRSIVFPVILSAPSTTTVTVQYATSASGAALPGQDFVAKSGTVTFARSTKSGITPTVRYISVAVNPDTSIEGDETFGVDLSNPSAGASVANGVGVGTIIDDDPGTGLRAGITDVRVIEGNAGAGNAVKVAVTLSSDATGPTSVLVSFVDVTTTNGVDYKTVKTAKLVTFKARQRQKQFSVKLYPDVRPEANETLSLSLSNPSPGLTIDRASGTVTIVDDD
jgi:probable HAF family extracellular repeat protein